jgi:hypothetical protein
VRRTHTYDPYDDHDDPPRDPGPNVRRISSAPVTERPPRRAELRPLHATRRPPPKRGPDPRVWFIRGSIGIAALVGLWLGLQALFPVNESRVSEAPTPAAPIDASSVGAPEPPAPQPAVPQPAAQQPVPTPAAQPTPAPEGDRLPGLPTPAPAAVAQPAPPAQAAPPPAQPAAEPKPREENPSQQAVGQPSLEPIPPPPSDEASDPPAAVPDEQVPQAAAAVRAAPAPAPKPQAPPPAPAPKPQAPPPAAAPTGGRFELAASASPVNPVSERANVTITVRATQNGAPVAGASCLATISYRTATVRQPEGGFRTNASGVGSFTLDAVGSTYGHYIPVDVTCTGRGGTASARTGFTPVRGR